MHYNCQAMSDRRSFFSVISPLILLLVLVILPPPALPAEDSPVDMIRQTSRELLARAEESRDEILHNPQRIYRLVEEYLLPHVDFERISRWILGRHWRGASEQQRGRFSNQFREMLIRTYSSSLLDYTDIGVEYLPLRAGDDPRKALVETRVRQGGAPPIQINYRVYERDGVWLVYDVTVEGISLVTTLRSSVAGEVRNLGLEGFLVDLEKRNAALIERDAARAATP